MSHVFSLLSEYDCSELIKKNSDGYAFIPWMNAHAVAKKQFPNYWWKFETNSNGLDYFLMPDGTAYVSITMTIEGETVCTSLPVFKGNSNELVTNPNANDVHNAKMRLRTRALGEFGLGHALWLQEYVEPEEPASPVAEALEQASATNPQDAMWADVTKEKTKASAKKAAEVYQQAVLGGNDLTDDTKARWRTLCAERRWK